MISTLLTLSSFAATAVASSEIALYWGQNSAGNEKSLASYCQNSPGDIYIISFINGFGNGKPISMNIHGYYNYISGTSLLEASSLGSDIQTCQQLGKKVLISLGGASGSYGLASDSEAESVATDLWNFFGGGQSSTRPFGQGVKVDGFDFDIENNLNAAEYATLANKLHELYASDSSKSYYTSAAPQCPFPDASVGKAIAGAHFDYLFVQFYNNYCSLTGSSFNFDTWQNFATTQSPNPSVKVFAGLAGSPTAAGSGYATIDQVKAHYSTLTASANFGGFSLWDASQANSNMVDGASYVQQLESLLQSGSSSVSSSASSTPVSSSTSTPWGGSTSSAVWSSPSSSSALLSFSASDFTVASSSTPDAWTATSSASGVNSSSTETVTPSTAWTDISSAAWAATSEAGANTTPAAWGSTTSEAGVITTPVTGTATSAAWVGSSSNAWSDSTSTAGNSWDGPTITPGVVASFTPGLLETTTAPSPFTSAVSSVHFSNDSSTSYTTVKGIVTLTIQRTTSATPYAGGPSSEITNVETVVQSWTSVVPVASASAASSIGASNAVASASLSAASAANAETSTATPKSTLDSGSLISPNATWINKWNDKFTSTPVSSSGLVSIAYPDPTGSAPVASANTATGPYKNETISSPAGAPQDQSTTTILKTSTIYERTTTTITDKASSETTAPTQPVTTSNGVNNYLTTTSNTTSTDLFTR